MRGAAFAIDKEHGADLRRRVKELGPWFQNIDFGNGITAASDRLTSSPYHRR